MPPEAASVVFEDDWLGSVWQLLLGARLRDSLMPRGSSYQAVEYSMAENGAKLVRLLLSERGHERG